MEQCIRLCVQRDFRGRCNIDALNDFNLSRCGFHFCRCSGWHGNIPPCSGQIRGTCFIGKEYPGGADGYCRHPVSDHLFKNKFSQRITNCHTATSFIKQREAIICPIICFLSSLGKHNAVAEYKYTQQNENFRKTFHGNQMLERLLNNNSQANHYFT